MFHHWNHYKTINKIHIKWSKNNVYTDAFEEIKNKNNECNKKLVYR